MRKKPKPWIDRALLITQATQFVKKHGYFLCKYAKRISGLVEIAVYNSIVSYYEQQNYAVVARNPGRGKSFRYRISPTGLIEKFSRFEVTDSSSGEIFLILQNVKIQSAHGEHLYYTPDVVVSTFSGAKTDMQKSGKRHSYVSNAGLLTFIEVKHLVPFPEALFCFTGLVQEFAPLYIAGTAPKSSKGTHLSPTIVFTGVPSEHSERIGSALTKRYGINVVSGTQKSGGMIASFGDLMKNPISPQPGKTAASW